MAVATELLGGNPSEWSLVRRHPSEKIFGVQLAGSRPHQVVPCVEALTRTCSSIDFLDLNTGCPLDLICKKGAGSALLDHGSKMASCLTGMSAVLGQIPVTVKMRTGVRAEQTAHNLILRASREPWNISAVTASHTAEHRFKLTCFS
jgi:tRNA-dihydrouridine synthase 3